jgi:undecaprenyl diphosphate synthase
MIDTASREPRHNQVPRHLAIVMDGNGRWAKKRLLPRLAGHRQGLQALRRMVGLCIERQIPVLSVFAFSSENWRRPGDEVGGLMELMAHALVREVPELKSQGVRLFFPGSRQSLPQAVQDGLVKAERETAHNGRLILNICFNYGGRWDVLQAAQRLQAEGKALTEEALSAALSMAHVEDPDLLIRTGGEHRVSNFMLWQLAYSELYFTDRWWPDFDAADLDAALADFASRERRFGRISEQLREENAPC